MKILRIIIIIITLHFKNTHFINVKLTPSFYITSPHSVSDFFLAAVFHQKRKLALGLSVGLQDHCVTRHMPYVYLQIHFVRVRHSKSQYQSICVSLLISRMAPLVCFQYMFRIIPLLTCNRGLMGKTELCCQKFNFNVNIVYCLCAQLSVTADLVNNNVVATSACQDEILSTVDVNLLPSCGPALTEGK